MRGVAGQTGTEQNMNLARTNQYRHWISRVKAEFGPMAEVTDQGHRWSIGLDLPAQNGSRFPRYRHLGTGLTIEAAIEDARTIHRLRRAGGYI